MISEIDRQTMRDLSRDPAAFEQLKALVERLLSTTGLMDAPPPSLQTDAAFLAAIVQSSQDAIFTKTVDGIITSWNPAAEKLLGYRAAEIIGQSIRSLLPPDEYATVALMDQRVAAGERIESFETVRRHKAGHAVDVSLTFSPIRAADGKILGISVIAHDITEKKQMRAALEASAQQLHSVLNTVQDAIFSVELPSSRLTYINPAGERLMGRTLQEFQADFEQRLALVHPDDLESARAQHTRLLAEGTAESEYRILHSNGAIRWVNFRGWLVRDADGRPTRYDGIGRDVTEIREVRAALEASERRLRNMLDTMQDGIFSVELPSAFMTYLNQAGERIMGQPLSAFQQDFELRLKIVHPEDREIARAGMARLLENGSAEMEIRLVHPDGSVRRVNNRAWITRDSENRPIRLDAMMRDITEIHDVRAALEMSEKRLRSLFDTLEDAIFSVELPSGRMTYVNPAGERQMGRTLQEFQENFELRLTMAYPDDLPIIRAGQARLLAEGTVEMEYRLVRPDGSIRWINTRAWLIRDDAQQPIRYEAISRDITALKEAEAVRQHMLDQEKELINLKARFISLASHEFRTPLAAILATTESLLLYRQRMTDEKITERLERIRQQVDYLRAIMEDVLLLSRFQAGGVEYRPIKGDIVALCHELIDELESQTAYTGRIHCDCPVQTMSTQFDPRLLRQAISNLLTNALKYSAAPQPVEMRLRYDEDAITLVVQDQGIGIPPDDLKRLFEPFHRAGNVGSIGGTGLGMSIAKQAVEAHGGTIDVTSAVGHGTTFTVSLPRQR